VVLYSKRIYLLITVAMLIILVTSLFLPKIIINNYKYSSPVISLVKEVDGNPSLYINGKKAPLLGLRTTSDPYEGEEKFFKVLRYIDLAAKYNYTFVEVTINWFTIDRSFREGIQIDRLPTPDEVKDMIDWSRLDFIFDYAAKKGVYIIVFFWYKLPPKWWFNIVKNYSAYLQTNQLGEKVLMMSFNNSLFLKYVKEVIKAIIERYRDHPAYLGFNLQFGYTNENNYPGEPQRKGEWFDYSEFAKRQFRTWLMRKYKSIDQLNKAWNTSYKNFDEVTPPMPLPPISDVEEMIKWINSPGDTRVSFYDWQMFRLEAKRSERIELFKFIKSIDPNHIVIGPASISLGLRYSNSLPIDFYDDESLKYVDIVHFCPGVVKPWTSIHKAGEYAFIKYFELKGKAVFIKWEGRRYITPYEVKPLKERALFAKRYGAGGVLWEGGVRDYPEFSEDQIKAFAEAYLSMPEGHVERAPVAIIVDPIMSVFDYRSGVGGLSKLSRLKMMDSALIMAILWDARLDFDLITVEDIIKNPEILNGYKLVIISNVFRVDDKFIDIVIKRTKGVILVQGRAALYDQLGKKNLTLLKRLLGINGSIVEINISNYNWSFLDCKNSCTFKNELYYVPIFNYSEEGYRILATVTSNQNIAVVGCKKNICFWFGGMGVYYFDRNCKSKIISFLKNLLQQTISW